MIKKFAISGSAKDFDSQVECPEISKFLKALGMVESSIEECEGLIFLNYNKKKPSRISSQRLLYLKYSVLNTLYSVPNKTISQL